MKNRNLLFILSLLLTSMSYAQSKKELIYRIDSLNSVVDSWKAVYSTEKLENSKLKTDISDLQTTIANLNSQVSNLTKELNLKKSEAQNQTQELSKIKEQLKVKSDSLGAIINLMPIQLKNSDELSLTNTQLIQLINILPSELGTDFISDFDPNLKPKFEIQGKQIFEWKGKKYALVVVGVSNPNDCHGCTGTNFINLIQWSSNHWVLIEKINTHSTPTNGWGNFAELKTICSTGKESIAIILSAGFGSQGSMEVYEIIYQFIDSQILKVYEGLLLENDGGNFGQKDIEYERSFIDNGREFFDLKETKKSNGKVVSTRTLKFNPLTQKYE